MEEKIYKTMGSTGAASLAVGICVDFGFQLLEAMRAQRMRRMKSSFVSHNFSFYLQASQPHDAVTDLLHQLFVVAYDQKPYFSFFHFRQQEVPDLALGDGI